MGKARLETDYLVAFRPEPDRPGGPTAAQRMRQLLKTATGLLGLRVITVAPALTPELEHAERQPEIHADPSNASGHPAESAPGPLLARNPRQ